jgi:hypothetical protein
MSDRKDRWIEIIGVTILFNVAMLPAYYSLYDSKKDDELLKIPEVHRADSIYQARRDSLVKAHRLEMDTFREKYGRK